MGAASVAVFVGAASAATWPARDDGGRDVDGGRLLHPNHLQPELFVATLPEFGVEPGRLMDPPPRRRGAVAWINGIMAWSGVAARAIEAPLG